MFLQACAGIKELDKAAVKVIQSNIDPVYVVSLLGSPKSNER